MTHDHNALPPVGSGRESWESYIRRRLLSVGDDYKELEAVCDVLSERCAVAETERDALRAEVEAQAETIKQWNMLSLVEIVAERDALRAEVAECRKRLTELGDF